jgi:hypothetical protein
MGKSYSSSAERLIPESSMSYFQAQAILESMILCAENI